MHNRYVISIDLNGQHYATFERGSERGRLTGWTDDVGDQLPPALAVALTSLESALEGEPSNEASHHDQRDFKALVVDALRGDETAKAELARIGDAQDAAQSVTDLLDRRA